MGIEGVVGDPAGMRAYGAQLRQSADVLATTVSAIQRSAAGLRYEGPAANAFRSRMSGWQLVMTGAITALNDAADLMLQGAGRVEAQQAEAARLRRAEEQRKAEEAQKTALENAKKS